MGKLRTPIRQHQLMEEEITVDEASYELCNSSSNSRFCCPEHGLRSYVLNRAQKNEGESCRRLLLCTPLQVLQPQRGLFRIVLQRAAVEQRFNLNFKITQTGMARTPHCFF